MLGFDDLRDATKAKVVAAGCDDWVVEIFQADSALFLRFNVHLQKILQTFLGLVIESHSP